MVSNLKKHLPGYVGVNELHACGIIIEHTSSCYFHLCMYPLILLANCYMVAISIVFDSFFWLRQIPIHKITHHADKATGCHVALDPYKHNCAAVSILSCVVYMHVLPILTNWCIIWCLVTLIGLLLLVFLSTSTFTTNNPSKQLVHLPWRRMCRWAKCCICGSSR